MAVVMISLISGYTFNLGAYDEDRPYMSKRKGNQIFKER